MMEPLDLRKSPPRSPRTSLGGLVMLARTIDKIRATLPGGNLGPYRMAGFSERLLEALGIPEDDLRTVVARAVSDEEVVAWVQERTDPSAYETLNERLAHRTIAHQAKNPEFFDRYPIIKERNLPPETTLFEMLEIDDAAMYAPR